MAGTQKPIDHLLAVPTFIGSLLSFLGSAIALGFHIARPPRAHFRHSLVISLLIADLIYGLGNTISGATFLVRGSVPNPLTPPDTACLVSGWFSQANAQFVDFNILTIAIVVLLSVVKKDSIAHVDTKWQILICIAAWVPGIITGTIGLTLGSYGYIGSNWCWIKHSRLDLRYALSHGWRIAIFCVTIIIYTYIGIKLKRVFANLRSFSTQTGTSRTMPHDVNTTPAADGTADDTQKILVNHSVSVMHEMDNLPRTPDTLNNKNDFTGEIIEPRSTVRIEGTTTSSNQAGETSFQASRMPAAPNVRNMLLLNGYPIAYIILWIPGIANRLAEGLGGAPRWLTALQATTQYIGLVNAVTYGMSEQMRRGAWKKLNDVRGRGRGR